MGEYAGDDASYHSDPGKSSSGQQSMASDSEIQPLWTAQLRASLTQIYEKCSVQVPTPLQRSSHLRPLLAASTSDLETPAVAPAARQRRLQPPRRWPPKVNKDHKIVVKVT